MRVEISAAHYALVLRSPPEAGVSKDGRGRRNAGGLAEAARHVYLFREFSREVPPP